MQLMRKELRDILWLGLLLGGLILAIFVGAQGCRLRKGAPLSGRFWAATSGGPHEGAEALRLRSEWLG